MASSTDAPPSRDAPPSQVSQTNSGGGAYKRRDEEVNEGGEREPAGRPRRSATPGEDYRPGRVRP